MRRVRVLGVIVGLGLLVCAPTVSSAPKQQRADLDSISRQVMCPTCDTTLDRSNSPAAKRMRSYITARIDDGWTEEQILDGLVREYGGDTSILATPEPTSHRGWLVWGIPLVLAVLCLIAGVVTIRRWRQRPHDA